MSPVIRLSDSTYNRLELHAIGFDTPNNVIDRFIDFYEINNKSVNNINSELIDTNLNKQALTNTSSIKTQRQLGRKGYKQLDDYLIPVIKLIEIGTGHTEAFHQIANKLNVTYQTVNAQCTRRLDITTEKFVELIRHNKIRPFLKTRFNKREIELLLNSTKQKGEEEGNKEHIKNKSIFTKKPRNVNKEKKYKKEVGEYLKNKYQFGDYKLNRTVLEFKNTGKKVLCKYSSCLLERESWFWGVGKKYWLDWDNNWYLVLIMENKNTECHSFLLLESNEAKHLFEKCSESNGEKKINLRRNKDDLLRFQEWKEYNVKKNILKLYR